MISFQTYQKIQEHKAYGASMLRTSQIMGLSYNTVYKWWDLTEDDFHAFESNEQINGDKLTDYASEFSAIELNVDEPPVLNESLDISNLTLPQEG